MDGKGWLSNIYVVEYAKRLFRKENVGIQIFLLLNLTLYIFLFGGFSTPMTIPMAVVLYLASITVALSPVGEFILRYQAGCKSMKKLEKKAPQLKERLEPLFEGVYARAKKEDPTMSDKVRFFVSGDRSPNAFATGRRTICVTRGLLDLTDQQIEAVLAHEFGHISHKDTDTLLVILVSNLLLSVLFFVYRIGVNLLIGILGVADRGFVSVGNVITRIFVDLLLVFFIRLWTKLGVLLCMHSSRRNEFEADYFACRLGYAGELKEALETICGDMGKSGFFASITASHPDTQVRLEKMEAYLAEHTFSGEREEISVSPDPEAQARTVPFQQQAASLLSFVAQKAQGMAAAFAPEGKEATSPAPKATAPLPERREQETGHPVEEQPVAPQGENVISAKEKKAVPSPRSRPVRVVPKERKEALGGQEPKAVPPSAEELPEAVKPVELAKTVEAVEPVERVGEGRARYVYGQRREDGYFYLAERCRGINGREQLVFFDGHQEAMENVDWVEPEILRHRQYVQGNHLGRGVFCPCEIKALECDRITVVYGDGAMETLPFQEIRFSFPA